jgi:lycopene cyclase domain-containing protein
VNVYLIYLLIFFAIPVGILGWLVRKDLSRYKRTILWCLVFIYTLGWVWDWLSVKTGVWRYDSAETVGLWLDGLPVEEFVGFYLLGAFLFITVFLAIRRTLKHV